MPKSIAVLILAAGASTRMNGMIKQLLPWGKTTLLENTVRHAKGVSDSIYVVLGAQFEKILESVSIDAEVIRNFNWESGMGSSVSYGLKHILEREKPDGVMLMVADQPLMDTAYLSQLIQDFTETESKIVATAYQNGAGVPAIFDNSLFSELKDLQAEFGARKIIKKYKEHVQLINPNGKEIDIDTREKYSQLTGIHKFKHE
ncbi:NTP transferase domain-containing protein [Flagellimonas sp. S3867]|uniref:nucleotidyltransferase family protein n=1 Tax=Flagellimonas sp. S3867 TaxID=2768063 RepID=UPI001685F300|nr:nucleotidyltransferase family protein [Flagellimonas sp. S3867]